MAVPAPMQRVPTREKPPMRRSVLLRAVTLALAFVHTFPARKHLALFVAAPSWSEGWKGIGALAAIGLYLLPVSLQARGLALLWQRRAWLLRVAGVVLAVAHAVPASDHLPRFFATGGLGDAWRGIGAAFAVVWFLAPLRVQARLLAELARWLRPSPSAKPAPVFDSI
jgi:hypothetical protein